VRTHAIGRWLLLATTLAACSSSQPPTSDAGVFLVGSHAGGRASAGSNAAGTSMNTSTGEGQGCSAMGDKRSCCGGKGTQVCSGTAEFKAWGPCLDAKGAAASCDMTQKTGCGIGEFSQCDAGVDSGVPHHCGEGEFGPSCEQPALCTDKAINNEPEILAAYAPAQGQLASANGQIKVWVNDERPELISAGEQIDAASGMITTPGDRTAKAPDGYLWEPALYISPDTAEKGGKPYFPQLIRGWYNNMPPYVRGAQVAGVEVTGMDAPPSGTRTPERYTTELVWDVSALGLKPGRYGAEFVIHDGDRDRAVGCVTIEVGN